MSIQSRREEERQARIDAIKEAAWKHFTAHGLENAKIANIAKDCRLGLATLYYYFKDKRQIVYALMLDFKNETNGKLTAMIHQKVTLQRFIEGYIDTFIEDTNRFRFFVLADNYYNYHHLYDLSDPILKEYDETTRESGNFILRGLSSGLDKAQEDKVRVAISMILGFLRRSVLTPEKSWPRTKKEETEMIRNLKKMSLGLFETLGADLNRPIEVSS